MFGRYICGGVYLLSPCRYLNILRHMFRKKEDGVTTQRLSATGARKKLYENGEVAFMLNEEEDANSDRFEPLTLNIDKGSIVSRL